MPVDASTMHQTTPRIKLRHWSRSQSASAGYQPSPQSAIAGMAQALLQKSCNNEAYRESASRGVNAAASRRAGEIIDSNPVHNARGDRRGARRQCGAAWRRSMKGRGVKYLLTLTRRNESRTTRPRGEAIRHSKRVVADSSRLTVLKRENGEKAPGRNFTHLNPKQTSQQNYHRQPRDASS